MLIRFNEDGSIGAHRRTITEIIEDGVVISARENEAEALATADGDERVSLARVLSEGALVVFSKNESLQEENRQLKNKVIDIEQDLHEKSASLTDSRELVNSLTAEVSALKSQILLMKAVNEA
ncbi:hypothetical protein [Pseudomonas plecoglossicida]|uniref:hypothetical protein n=1 Tax=Pseudomonas plecoglossicida TaxID=70775 RepID=UPI001269EA12|nr:hypothetical protein [Pseudomonas plecoglossicida]